MPNRPSSASAITPAPAKFYIAYDFGLAPETERFPRALPTSASSSSGSIPGGVSGRLEKLMAISGLLNARRAEQGLGCRSRT